MYKMTWEIRNRLELMDYEVDTLEYSDMSGVSIECESKSGTHYSIWFMSSDDENDVGVRVKYLFRNLSDEKRQRMLPLLNRSNAAEDMIYNIYCDSDGDVLLSYDFTEGCPAPAEYVPGMIQDIQRVVDKILPELQDAIAPCDTDD